MLEERNPAAGCSSLCIRAATFAAGHKAAGVDDTDTAFAATHRAPQCRSLPERQEGMAREASGHDRMPEGKHIDAAVPARTDGIVGHADAGIGRSPRLHQWEAASFAVRNDPVSDFLVEKIGGTEWRE